DPAADKRVDFYSFGCVAYELFTGHPPFFGRAPQAILAAHLTEVPPPVETVAPDVPPHVAKLIDRCLSKSAGDRPQSGREILEVLDAVQSPHRIDAIGKKRADWRMLAGAGALLAVMVVGYSFARRAPAAAGATPVRAKAVAVLPFTDTGGESSEAYFADGMADELIAALGKVPELSVASRRSAFALRQRSDLDIPSIGRLLHVDAILEGTVRRAGNRLRVTAQLTGTTDGLALWSDSYERDAKDVFAVQDDITRSIVGALRLRLGTGQRQVTTNLSAYDDYLRGAYALEQRGPGVRQSVELFNSAIAKDSSFARAYGKLSEALEFLPYFAGVSAASLELRAVTAANKALALDPSTAEAHIGLALALGHAFRWRESDRHFQLAIAADSNNAVARTQYGRHLLHQARIPEAIEQLKRGVTLDPLSGTQVGWLAYAHALNGQLPLALGELATAREKFGGLDLVRQMSAQMFLRAGKNSQAIELARTISSTVGFHGQGCYVLGKAGEREESSAIIREMLALPDTTWLKHTALAYCYFGIGDNDKALRQMELAFQAREITPKWMPFGDPLFDEVRGSPRFASVVHNFGLDEKLFTSPNLGRPAK
ncbi:MAG: hypothetical protein H0W63_08420, partial [Gemmatimonadaceae bacterium]|nr:hypothetical protein [Gemmatimonadaceae bacterium]